jgi:multimeric flavodoxin WrbA
MKVLLVSTTTNERGSSSRALCVLVAKALRGLKHDVKYIDANKIHIVKNLSCYSDGGQQCADPSAGPYRCWAHKHAEEEPEKYGGRDEMPLIYDGIEWADAVVFATSVRWGSHTALLQTIIERMNTLENRQTVYGEKNPLWGKRCGVIVTGQHWKSAEVANRLVEVFDLYGFDASPGQVLSWQRTLDMNEELEENNASPCALDMASEEYAPILEFVKNMGLAISEK